MQRAYFFLFLWIFFFFSSPQFYFFNRLKRKNRESLKATNFIQTFFVCSSIELFEIRHFLLSKKVKHAFRSFHNFFSFFSYTTYAMWKYIRCRWKLRKQKNLFKSFQTLLFSIDNTSRLFHSFSFVISFKGLTFIQKTRFLE